MAKIHDISIYLDEKTTKQLPLFEEEDDGNLVPYHEEE